MEDKKRRLGTGDSLVSSNSPASDPAYDPRNAGQDEIDRLYRMLKQLYGDYRLLEKENLKLKTRIEELERPSDGYRSDWTWTRKILFAIEKTGRPMRSAEIIDFLAPREVHLREHTSQRQFFSALLNSAVKTGRLMQVKKMGERGFYYSEVPTEKCI